MYAYNVEYRCNAMKPNQDAETMFCLSSKEGSSCWEQWASNRRGLHLPEEGKCEMSTFAGGLVKHDVYYIET